MGLDLVEFVMEVENEFGIKIPDSEAAKTVTVGQFVDLVYFLLPDESPKQLADDKVCCSLIDLILFVRC